MKQELDAQKFLDLAERVYEESKQASIELLKAGGENCFIACGDCEDSIDDLTTCDGDIVNIFAVGLDEVGDLSVCVCDPCTGDQYWTSVSDIGHNSWFPEIYRFIADNMDKTMTKAEADEIMGIED